MMYCRNAGNWSAGMPWASLSATTGAPRATPTVMSLCALAAIGALMAAVIAAMASILFRMMNSFSSDAGRFARAGNAHPIHRAHHRSRNNVIVPRTMSFASLRFSALFVGHFSQGLGTR
jgi:hypothetical protein